MTLDEVFIRYAKAMLSAQRLELRLKGLAILHRVLSKIASTSVPLSDDEFEILLSAGGSATLGRLVRDLLSHLESLGAKFPSVAEEALHTTVRMRNHLAHGFLEANQLLLDNLEARQLLSEQLDWSKEVFTSWIPILDRITDQLVKSLELTSTELLTLRGHHAVEQVEIQSELLKQLREQVVAISDEPSVPRAP